MKYDLVSDLVFETDIGEWEFGKRLLSGVFGIPKLSPQRIATFGEVSRRNGTDVTLLDDCEEFWGRQAILSVGNSKTTITEDFHWKRNGRLKSLGVVTFPGRNMLGGRIPGGIFFLAQFGSEPDWLNLFRSWCAVSSSELGGLHVITEDAARISRAELGDEIQIQAWSRFLHGTFKCAFRVGDTNRLISGLTNIGWAMWFGDAYAHEVDERRISGEGFPIEKIGNSYLVRVTDRIEDVVSDFNHFSNRRAKLKSLFREGLFMINEEPLA